MLALLAAGFLALGVAEARADAPTFDEPVYVSAGLAALLHHDVTLNDEHPPLPKVLAVLPVVLTHPVVPAEGRSGHDELRYGARFVAAQLAAGKLRSVTFASRLAPLAETAGVAFVLFGIAGLRRPGHGGVGCSGGDSSAAGIRLTGQGAVQDAGPSGHGPAPAVARPHSARSSATGARRGRT